MMFPSLINRQYGLAKGKNVFDIDWLLSRLTCHEEDEYPGIFSTTNSAPSSDLLYVCKFAQSSGIENIFALANEDGKVALQDINIIGKSRPVHGFKAHENAIFDLCWAPSSWKIVTGSGDQTSVLFDIGNSTATPLAIFRGHTASVKTVEFSPTNPSTFASGSRDGSIMVWDVRGVNPIKPENIIRNAHPVCKGASDVKPLRVRKKITPSTCTSNSVTSLVFQDDYNILSGGAADGNIHLWDLRKNYTIYKGDPLPKMSINYGRFAGQSGISSLTLNPGKTLLYAAAMDDVIYEFNVSSYDDIPVGIYGGHKQHSFYIKSCLSGDGKYLLSGSADHSAYIWRVGGGPRPLVKLEGHGAEVTCVAWCASSDIQVVTCADDVRHRVWRINLATDADEDEQRRIRGHAVKTDSSSPVSSACEDVLSRMENLTSNVSSVACKTPKSVSKVNTRMHDKTPDIISNTPRSSREQLSACTPRIALSTLKENVELTPTQCASGINRAAASRRLEMDSTDYASPTRDLPNYVIDGLSPHSRVRSGTKRKKLDWLTDLSRKLSPNPQKKSRKIK